MCYSVRINDSISSRDELLYESEFAHDISLKVFRLDSMANKGCNTSICKCYVMKYDLLCSWFSNFECLNICLYTNGDSFKTKALQWPGRNFNKKQIQFHLNSQPSNWCSTFRNYVNYVVWTQNGEIRNCYNLTLCLKARDNGEINGFLGMFWLHHVMCCPGYEMRSLAEKWILFSFWESKLNVRKKPQQLHRVNFVELI